MKLSPVDLYLMRQEQRLRGWLTRREIRLKCCEISTKDVLNYGKPRRRHPALPMLIAVVLWCLAFWLFVAGAHH